MHPLIDDAAWLQNRLRWRMLPNFTIRNGDMKLSMIEREADGVLRAFLFVLAKDPGETSNLAGARPEEGDRFVAMFETWNATLSEPGCDSNRVNNFILPDNTRVKVYN